MNNSGNRIPLEKTHIIVVSESFRQSLARDAVTCGAISVTQAINHVYLGDSAFVWAVLTCMFALHALLIMRKLFTDTSGHFTRDELALWGWCEIERQIADSESPSKKSASK